MNRKKLEMSFRGRRAVDLDPALVVLGDIIADREAEPEPAIQQPGNRALKGNPQ